MTTRRGEGEGEEEGEQWYPGMLWPLFSTWSVMCKRAVEKRGKDPARRAGYRYRRPYRFFPGNFGSYRFFVPVYRAVSYSTSCWLFPWSAGEHWSVCFGILRSFEVSIEE